jgi:hypothetical protein
LIATGFLFWLNSRRKTHAQLRLPGVRVAEALAIGSTTGIIIATLAYFVANRILSPGASFAGYERPSLEVWCFYVVWIATFGHACWRARRGWAEHCWLIAGLAFGAVALNWITTGDHLVRSLAHSHLWPVAGMDLLLLLSGAVAVLSARKLDRQSAAPATLMEIRTASGN